MMFLKCNENRFQEYRRQHDQALGPDLASRVHIGREPCRQLNCTLIPIETALATVQEIWKLTETKLESGQWNISFMPGTVIGPYSFPMISTQQFPGFHLFGRYYEDIVDLMQVDKDCYKVHADPDEVVYVNELNGWLSVKRAKERSFFVR